MKVEIVEVPKKSERVKAIVGATYAVDMHGEQEKRLLTYLGDKYYAINPADGSCGLADSSLTTVERWMNSSGYTLVALPNGASSKPVEPSTAETPFVVGGVYYFNDADAGDAYRLLVACGGKFYLVDPNGKQRNFADNETDAKAMLLTYTYVPNAKLVTEVEKERD